MQKFNSFELTEFNLGSKKIDLNEKCGLVKIFRSDDGKLSLVVDASFDLIAWDVDVDIKFARIDSLLGFVLDIGIQREKQLTHGDGFYFGTKLIRSPQSTKEILQEDFDDELLEQIYTKINDYYQSGDNSKELNAIKLTHLFDAYNSARLLYPNFYNDSYLALMRILDSISNGWSGYDFAMNVANLSNDWNREIYEKIRKIGSYRSRIVIAENLFSDCLKLAKVKKWKCFSTMARFDKHDRFVFACFYSAYQYRSKFVHQGFPFPSIGKVFVDLEKDDGTAYLGQSVASAHMKSFRPGGYQEGDDIDIHEVISLVTPKDVDKFKNVYFLLMPTWHFLKRVVRLALMEEIKKL